jgi:hypothetical protein
MDNPESREPSGENTTRFQAEYDNLRQHLISLILLVIILSAVFNLFLLRQVKLTRTDLQNIRPQALVIINDYQTNSRLVWDDFVRQVAAYGHQHPDFAPIMKAYGLDQVTTNAAAPGTAKK